MNYHTLSDFRIEAGPLLDELLSQLDGGADRAGLVDVDYAGGGWHEASVAGQRTKLVHGAASGWRSCIGRLGDGPASCGRRSRRTLRRRSVGRRPSPGGGAGSGAADGEGGQAQAEIEASARTRRQKQRRKEERKDHEPARASTSDPRGADHEDGRRQLPACLQRADQDGAEGAHIVGVSVTDCGSDHGLLSPALDEIKQRYDLTPQRVLADGGYISKADIESLHARGVELFCPLPRSKSDPSRPGRGTDPAPSPGVSAWPATGTAIYRRRFATERPHAHMRNHGLDGSCAWHRKGQGRRALARPCLQLPAVQETGPGLTASPSR